MGKEGGAWCLEPFYLCRPTCWEPREEGWEHGGSDGWAQQGFQPDLGPSWGRWRALECTTSRCPLPPPPVIHFRQG